MALWQQMPSINRIPLADKPIFLAGNELETLAQQTDFRGIEELKILNREAEAKRQWWFTIKKFTQRTTHDCS